MRPSWSGWAWREWAASPRWPAGASGSSGLVRGLKSLGPPYLFCSLRTAYQLQPLFRDYPGHTMYLLGRCRTPADAPAVARRLRERSDLSVFTREEFSARTQIFWATRTEAGIGMGFTALLSLLVGMAVTSQTLYAATAASLREYAVLRALGIPRWRMAGVVMAQSLWVGLGGIAAGPAADVRAGGRRRRRRRPRALASAGCSPSGSGLTLGDGPVVRPGRLALAPPGRADHPPAMKDRPRCSPSRP